jgi:hypothetical protein
MTDCKNSNDYYDLTFNGSVACDGTFSTTHKAFVFSSGSLGYTGTVGQNVNAPVSGTCEVSIVQENTNLSGTICGRSFDN